MTLIEVDHVSKWFRRRDRRKLLGQRLAELFRRGSPEDNFLAVRNVSFQVGQGESVALMGANGAGKSTLLALIAGLTDPDEGTVKVTGRIATLLHLGSGFHPDLTGEENIYLHAALLGFSERGARARFSEIVKFAELGDFVGESVRTYSNGMILRLAFSIAVHANPQILIVDEVLGVGDSHFQDKSASKVAELREQGVTLLCVSHSSQMVADFCDRAIWLHHGGLILDGPAGEIEKAYAEYSNNPERGLPV
jgi:ABC-type polysaccharide/polyol phosphate transport system ATPase subunit